MTFAAYSLARQLAQRGLDYCDVWERVRAAGFRITAEEAADMAERWNPPAVIEPVIIVPPEGGKVVLR